MAMSTTFQELAKILFLDEISINEAFGKHVSVCGANKANDIAVADVLLIRNTCSNSPFRYIYSENPWQSNCFPQISISKSPLLFQVPNVTFIHDSYPVRWVICLGLVTYNTNPNLHRLIMSFHPKFPSAFALCSWASSKVVISQCQLNYENHITLFAFTRFDLASYFARADSDLSVELNLDIWCDSLHYEISLLNPLIVSEKSLLSGSYDFLLLSNYLSQNGYFPQLLQILNTVLSYCKKWSLSPQIQLNDVVRFLESKLGSFCAISAHSVVQSKYYFISSGFFSGICISFTISDGINIVCEARANSPSILDLLHRTLSHYSTPVCFHLVNSKTSHLKLDEVSFQDRISRCLNQLDEEITFLVEETSNLIKSTMQSRIPDISLYSHAEHGNILEVSHSLNEWREVIRSSCLTPITANNSKAGYDELYLKTDLLFEHLCE